MTRRRGFTLIEILVVMGLLAVLMGFSVGFIVRAQSGNKLLVTTNRLADQFATARAQAYGSATAYVLIQSNPAGKTSFRTFRDRQVFAWACEDFTKASEDVLKRMGGVDVSKDTDIEGRYAVFTAGGSVELGDPPWLDFLDGFTFQCRLKPDPRGGVLFRKGDALVVSVLAGPGGRLDLEAKIRLQRDEQGKGEGLYELRTGQRAEAGSPNPEPAMVTEWTAPLLAGQWQTVRIAYDRNTFSIVVDGRTRALRTERTNRMQMNDQPFVIGAGYEGGFDSLVISGIFEDDDDYYPADEIIRRVDWEGKVVAGNVLVHFRNRSLDPQYHQVPVRVWLEMMEGPDKVGERRVVEVALSGETFIRMPEEVR